MFSQVTNTHDAHCMFSVEGKQKLIFPESQSTKASTLRGTFELIRKQHLKSRFTKNMEDQPARTKMLKQVESSNFQVLVDNSAGSEFSSAFMPIYQSVSSYYDLDVKRSLWRAVIDLNIP